MAPSQGLARSVEAPCIRLVSRSGRCVAGLFVTRFGAGAGRQGLPGRTRYQRAASTETMKCLAVVEGVEEVLTEGHACKDKTVVVQRNRPVRDERLERTHIVQ